MLDEQSNIGTHNKFKTKQSCKDTLISKMIEWLFYIVILFFIGFFIGTKIYQISMPVHAHLDIKMLLFLC